MIELHQVHTPENVSFRFEVAGIGPRFLAAVIDHTIIGLFSVLSWVVASGRLATIDFSSAAGRWTLAVWSLVLFACQWGYFVLFDYGWNGQSPGKRLLGLRIVRLDGTAIQLIDSLVRNLLRPIDFLPANYFLGLVVLIFNDHLQRLGDIAAGTVVIRDRPEMSIEQVLEYTRKEQRG